MSRFFKQQGDSDSDSEESEEELLSSGEDEAPAPSTKLAAAPAKGMSRFLRTGSDESSSSSESEDEDEESDSDAEAAQPQKKVSRFRRDQEDESEDEEDVKRIVKSAKDKRLEEMEATGKGIENALKINDWVAISNGVFWSPLIRPRPHPPTEFDKLVRLTQRQTNVAERIPSFYIRTLSGLEDSLNNAIAKEKEAKKKMNASNARALNGMKQKVKKINKEYETEIKRFQEVCL